MTLPDTRERFNDIAALLASTPGASTIRTGFAQLTADETAAELIARADRDLLDHRNSPGRDDRQRPAASGV